MGDPTRANKQQQKIPIQVSPELRCELQTEFEKRYKTPGKVRARTGELLNRWQIDLDTEDRPSDQAILNLLNGKRGTSELWIVDGLCRLLLGCWYAEWVKKSPRKTENAIAESPKEFKAIPPCPYKGLSAFEKNDAEFFFGRKTFTKELVTTVRKKPFVAVIGRSGEGKSSVVFAGLIPQLDKEGGWVIASFSPKNRPFYRLAEALIPLLEPEMSKTQRLLEVKRQADALQQGNLALQDIVETILQENSSSQRLLLVVDQFEELYTLCNVEQEQRQFLDLLFAAVEAVGQKRTPDFTLVITLRSDFLGQAHSYRPFVDALQHNQLILGSMNRKELQDAIEKPADKLGVKLQDGLTKIILDAVDGKAGSLPLLEFALKLLWEKQSEAQMTHAAYEEIGGIENALAKHAEDVYQKLTENKQQRLQHIFTQLVRPGEGTEDTRRLATRAEVGEDNWDLVTDIAEQNARLVVTGYDRATEQPTVEVVHEALIRGWERLREWMESDRQFRIWQERLRTAINVWENSRRDEGALLRGALLVEAEDWIKEREAAISSAEKEFIQASRKYQEQEVERERELRRRAELSEIEAMVALSQTQLLLQDQLGALVSSVKAAKKLREIDAPSDLKLLTVSRLQQTVYKIKECNRFQAHSSVISAVSILATHFSPDGQKLASVGWDGTVKLWNLDGTLLNTPFQGDSIRSGSVCFSPDGQTFALARDIRTIELRNLDGTLIKSFRHFDIDEMDEENDIVSLSFSPDGQILVSLNADSTLRLWSLDGTLQRTLNLQTIQVTGFKFSPDGQTIALISMEPTLKLWNLDGELLQILEGHSHGICGVSFSSHGQIASASYDATVKLWSSDGSLLNSFERHSDMVCNVSFSPDNQILASASSDRTVKLWRLDGTLIETFYHNDTVSQVTFSPNGETLTSATNDGMLRFWSLKGTPLKTLEHSDWGVNSVSFSPVGSILASAGFGGTIKLWSRDGVLLTPPIQAHSDSINNVVFSSDGRILASASGDNTIKLWRYQDTSLSLTGHRDSVTCISFSSKSQILASASMDRTIKLWQYDGSLITTLTGHNDWVTSVSFSPDGHILVSVSVDGTMKFWRSDGKLINSIQVHPYRLDSVTFSPDGQILISTGGNNTLKLWNQNGKLLKTIQVYSSDSVKSVSFSPDSQTFATANDNHTVQLWSRDGQLLNTLEGHSLGVNSVTFSPDGKTLASANGDGKIILWNLDIDDLLVRACDWLCDYLKNPNANVSESERHLCGNICTLQAESI